MTCRCFYPCRAAAHVCPATARPCRKEEEQDRRMMTRLREKASQLDTQLRSLNQLTDSLALHFSYLP